MAGGVGRAGHVHAEHVRQDPHDGQTHRHQGGLRIFRQGQFRLGTFLHQLEQVLAQRLIHGAEHVPCDGKRRRQRAAHADGLTSLSRKQKG